MIWLQVKSILKCLASTSTPLMFHGPELSHHRGLVRAAATTLFYQCGSTKQFKSGSFGVCIPSYHTFLILDSGKKNVLTFTSSTEWTAYGRGSFKLLRWCVNSCLSWLLSGLLIPSLAHSLLTVQYFCCNTHILFLYFTNTNGECFIIYS